MRGPGRISEALRMGVGAVHGPGRISKTQRVME